MVVPAADHTPTTTPSVSTRPKHCFPISCGKGSICSTDPWRDNRGDHLHAGVDLTSSGGAQPIYAVTDGVITDVVKDGYGGGGWIILKATVDVPAKNGGGNVISKGEHFFYGHCGVSASVSKGQNVSGCSQIGTTHNPGGGYHVHFSKTSGDTATPNADNPADNPTALLQSLANDGDKPVSGGGGGGSSGGGADLQQLTSIAQAAAFAGTLELPSAIEIAEAEGLQGQKSLLNDKPLLPFIQQLATAALRQFMSMPNGNIFFFFPDYFGEAHHRAPYWEIDDIEVLDGRIELSDDSLATHVYVVGDTTMQANENLNALNSRGVVTIQNAFQQNVIVNTEPNAKAKAEGFDTLVQREDALKFLTRYGARPYVEDMPMIHSSYFEMFYAYQKFMQLWSRQFLTEFTFTFMPELFPGGKVGFPQHALQMYIEEVNHSFDYENGFVTQATLSSPSVYIGPNTPPEAIQNLPPNMVRALISPSSNVEIPKKPAKRQNTKK